MSGVDVTSLILAGAKVSAQVAESIQAASVVRTIDGAGTLELSVHDPDRKLIRSPLFAQKTTATIDGSVYELVQVRKTGSFVDVTFEDAVVADLRKAKGLLSAKAGSTTIDAFARRLMTAPGAKLVAFTGQKNLAALARGRVNEKGVEDEPKESSWEALQRLADERRWRCFADRGTVYFGPDSWLYGRSTPVRVSEFTNGVEDIDWDADSGKKAVRATFTANIGRWSVPPGQSVTLVDQGIGSGPWLVEEVRRPLTQVQGTIQLVRQQPVIPESEVGPRDDSDAADYVPSSAGGQVVAGPVSALGFAWPVTGPLTGAFGEDRPGHTHAGQDIAVPVGTPIAATDGGTVTVASVQSGYGNVVYIKHDGGVESRYAHLSSFAVRPGQSVKRGEVIGRSGNTGTSTGPHLHFEIRVDGRARDPLTFLPGRL